MNSGRASLTFLSHNSADKQSVEEIARYLADEEGFNVYLDKWHLIPGDPWQEALENALDDSTCCVVFVGPHGFGPWHNEEMRSALDQRVGKRTMRVVPVLLPGAKQVDGSTNLPRFLKRLLWVEFRENLQEHDTLKRLAAGIRGQSPGRAETLDTSSALYCVPPILATDNPEDFIGRRDTLGRLKHKLVEKTGRFLIHGLPGAGKSTLARMFAFENRDRFETVVFQVCGQRPVETIAGELAEKLGLDLKRQAPEKIIPAIHRTLTTRRALLILDDAWEDKVGGLIPPTANTETSVLCTSRARRWNWIGPKDSLELGSFTDEEVRQAFERTLDLTKIASHWEGLRAMANRMNRLPIAVTVAANILADSIGDLSKAAEDLRLAQLSDGIHDVNDVWAKAIENRSEEEKRLLRAMTVCAPEGFWLGLPIRISGLTESDGARAAQALVKASLLREFEVEWKHFGVKRHRYQIHALLREHLEGSTDLASLRERHAESLLELFEDWEDHIDDCRELLSELDPSVRFLWQEGRKCSVSTLAEKSFGLAYRIGELAPAHALLLLEKSLLEKGAVDLDAKNQLQRIARHLGIVYHFWGKLDEAMLEHKKSEAICHELGDKSNLQKAYTNQALTLQQLNKFDEPMLLHKQAESICRALGDSDGIGISLANQALILSRSGATLQAMILHLVAEEVFKDKKNEDALQIGFGNQAQTLAAMGQLDSAMALLLKQEEVCLRIFKKHSLQSSYGGQAAILTAFGRLDEAMVLLKQQEAICHELRDPSALRDCFSNMDKLQKEMARRSSEI